MCYPFKVEDVWAKNFKNGFKVGSKVAAVQIFRGFTGVVMEPRNGFKKQGIKGGAIGIGKGLAGFIG